MRHRKPLESTSTDDLQSLWSVNYFSFRRIVVDLIKMNLINKISLVYISSIVSSLGFVDLDDYGATKAASESLVRSLSVRFPSSRFNAIALG